MTDHRDERAPSSAGEPLDALSPAFAGGGIDVASIPADRVYRLAALTAGIFLLVSLL
jgi:hypothetical protein